MKKRIRDFLHYKTLAGLMALATFFLGLAFGDEISPSAVNSTNFAAKLHMDRGLAQMEKGNLYYAAPEFEFIINMEYDTGFKSVAYLNLGVIRAMENNPNEAVRYYHSAIQLRPDYAEAYFNLGVTYYKQGNLKNAEEALLKALELQPTYGRAHYSLGFVYLDQKKYDLAREHAEKAAEYGVPYKSLKERLDKIGK